MDRYVRETITDSMLMPHIIPITTPCRPISTDALRLAAPIAILGLGFTG